MWLKKGLFIMKTKTSKKTISGRKRKKVDESTSLDMDTSFFSKELLNLFGGDLNQFEDILKHLKDDCDNEKSEVIKMDQLDLNDRDIIRLKKTDCGIIIDSVDLNMGIIFPVIDETQEITSNVSQAMFLVSYLSHALQQNAWIEEFSSRFNEENLNKLQNANKQYNDIMDLLSKVSDEKDNEINFVDAIKEMHVVEDKQEE
jgi:hypothetical protein